MQSMDSQLTALSPLRVPIFRNVWLASLCSNFGGLIQSVGAAWLMLEMTRQADMVALVQTSVALPVVLFSLLGGAIADSLDRRRVMLAAQFFMLVVSAALAVCAWQDLLTPWLLLGFTFLIGCGASFNGPAWQASVQDMVTRPQLSAAVALNSMGFNLARSTGPAIGGDRLAGQIGDLRGQRLGHVSAVLGRRDVIFACVGLPLAAIAQDRPEARIGINEEDFHGGQGAQVRVFDHRDTQLAAPDETFNQHGWPIMLQDMGGPRYEGGVIDDDAALVDADAGILSGRLENDRPAERVWRHGQAIDDPKGRGGQPGRLQHALGEVFAARHGDGL